MKNIIIGLLAATMLSTTAIAACSTKEDIQAMNGIQSMNKGQLSERDKCWLDVYADKTHGVDGNLFWIKVGNEYYSKNLVEVAYKPNRDLWKKSIQADVKDSYLAVYKLNNELETKAGIIQAAAAVVSPAQLDTMKTELDEVKVELVEAINKVAVEPVVAPVADAIIAANPPLSQEDQYLNAYNDGYVQGAMDVNEALQSYLENVDLYRDMARGFLKNIMKAEQTDAYKAGNGTKDNSGSNTHAIVDDGNVDVYSETNHVVATVDISGFDFSATEWNKIEAAVSDAFDQGYDQGYDAGYADGYADGFKDGVDSVK